LTEFTITDAIDLEEGELKLTERTLRQVQYYGKVRAADRLFEKSDGMCDALLSHGPNLLGKDLIKGLFHALMR